MSRKRDLSAEEKELWRRVAARVKPRRPVVAAPMADPAPRAEKEAPRAKRAPAAPPSPPVVKKRAPAPPQDRGPEKRVRRGKVEPMAVLDLHGHTLDAARAALSRFLHRAQRGEARVVLVVTGKGRAGEGAIKRHFLHWLGESEMRPLISGYAQAHQSHGGAGAFYVFLKRAN